MERDSATSVELALRSAMIAKSVLEMMNMSPAIARMQLNDVAEKLLELQTWLKGK